MGQVEAIYIGDRSEGPMRAVPRVTAVAGRGLEGDRYFHAGGTFSKKTSPGREVTLIEAEAVEAANEAYDLQLGLGDPRRNIVTRGVSLNHLVGEEFSLGDVRIRGVKLCEPCGHLESLTEKGVKKALIHRGGLRGEIVSGGTISVGDPFCLHSAPL